MSRIFIDGFESGGSHLWDTRVGLSVSSGIAGMDGNYCLYANQMDYAEKIVPSKSEYWCAFRFRPSSSSNAAVVSFYNNTNLLGYLKRNTSTNVLEAWRNGALLASGSATVAAGTTYLIEVHYKPDSANGVFQVKVNGIADIDFAGNSGTTADINRVRLGFFSGTIYAYCYYDNFILDDSGWIGDTRIQVIQPTGAGNSTQWDPSTGSNWDCVDEIPASETDYVYTNTADEVDLYTFSNLSGNIESIKCVQVQALAKKEGLPTPQSLQLAVRSGGTNYFSGSKALPSTIPKAVCHLWETDPNSGSAWTESGVNNAEFGFKSVS